QRCLLMGELALCQEEPSLETIEHLQAFARDSPELHAQVKATVLVCLDELHTTRPVDRGLVLWLAVNAAGDELM
ncbi:MAG: hypothetical protein JRH20_20375, partial [Deltaproteobacteria bacterium]|nr:hypothetical protein [Deltaproteobacteria bacterium]